VKLFGHQRPVRDAQGQITGMIDSPAKAITRHTCGGMFGVDASRKLIVSLEAGDLVCLRPAGTRRVYRVEASDLFHWLLRTEANRVTLEKARERKAKKAERLAAQRQIRAEKKLFRK
jgi:hypothetical protein